MATLLYKQYPSSNIRLRDDLIDTTRFSATDYRFSWQMGIFSPAYVSGSTWIWAGNKGVYNPINMGHWAGRYYWPFFYLTPGSTTISDVTTAYNYGWQVGDSITGYNDYGSQYMGSATGTLRFTGELSGNIVQVRQVVYNSTRGQLAVRASSINNPAGRTQFIDRVTLASYSAAGTAFPNWNQYLGYEAVAYGQYEVGADATSVWVWTASGLPSSPVGVSFLGGTG